MVVVTCTVIVRDNRDDLKTGGWGVEEVTKAAAAVVVLMQKAVVDGGDAVRLISRSD